MIGLVAWDTVLIAGIVSVMAPVALVIGNGYVAHRGKQEEWNRQDIVAEHAQVVADRADQAAIAAHQAAVQAHAVAVTAAAQADRSAAVIDTIHTLVNSNLTAALQGQLLALQGQLALSHSLAAEGGRAGEWAAAAIPALHDQVTELTAQVADRAEAQKIVDDRGLIAAAADLPSGDPM